MLADEELRRFLERLLGWSSDRAVDHALRSIDLAATHRAHLVLCGEGDLVPTAHALHRRMAANGPFIVCDPRRGNMRESVRSPANFESGLAAFEAAVGGSLCVRSRRLPRDFLGLAARLRNAEDVVLLVVRDDKRDDLHPLLVRPEPITVPPLASRAGDLPRIIDEYAADAMTELGALNARFTEADRRWVGDHAATSLAEIEKATLRLVAIRTSRNVSVAAARLGMAPVSLIRWVQRRTATPRLAIEPMHPS